ncbi:MAG: hypothetical protein JSW14_07850 [Candidatus Bathyarchaeum sp.]|nr:MAG: hypothetical protein JSW14_07850 [Candidatus Bathyarchaeum sp.]
MIFSRFFRLKSYETLAFIPIFSVLVSTQLIYYLSLVLSYSRLTILVSFFILAVVYALVNSRKKEACYLKNFLKTKQLNKATLLIFLLIFTLALIILYRSIWFGNENGIVITGSNWQDTPLHYEIIESINNGNFPPQMPYYSGEQMNYHYFVDFHTAILEKVYGFLPKLLPISNAIFILIFAFSIYSLARGNGERAAAFSLIIATFGWGFSYIILFSGLTSGQFNPLLNYSYQYDEFFGLPPIFDNLLQQRPLLIGLPAFALVLTLLRNMEDRNRILLAGIVTGLLFPFHAISFVCVYVAYFISIVLNLKNFKKYYLYFLVSAIIALPSIISRAPSVPFSLAPLWAFQFIEGNPILYYIMNLGIPFLIALALILTKVEGKLLKIVFVSLFLVPNLVSITPNPWDMYKFFTFAWIPIAILSGAALAKIRRSIALTLLLLSILASSSVIVYNLSTNRTAANWDEYNLGMWVRDNTEERAVFLAYSHSIHCPPTMIGGRLRVSSYINWPYGHGIPLGDIWERVNDVDRAYSGSEDDLREVVETYNVTYIYVGGEELKNYPGCVAKFDSIEWLTLVYNGRLRIYKIVFQ